MLVGVTIAASWPTLADSVACEGVSVVKADTEVDRRDTTTTIVVIVEGRIADVILIYSILYKNRSKIADYGSVWRK